MCVRIFFIMVFILWTEAVVILPLEKKKRIQRQTIPITGHLLNLTSKIQTIYFYNFLFESNQFGQYVVPVFLHFFFYFQVNVVNRYSTDFFLLQKESKARE